MVDPDSDGVSRAPPYLGTVSRRRQRAAYGALTLFGGLFQNPSATLAFSHSAAYAQTALQPHSVEWFRLLPFRSPLLRESLLFSVPGVLRWFSSPSFASTLYFIQMWMTRSLSPGYPIRTSADHRVFASPHGFSQFTTSFFALLRQGIHHKPIFA